MPSRFIYGKPVLFMILALALLFSQCGERAEDLSANGKISGNADSGDAWVLKGESASYIGDDLFIYINGGAEIYHEYGFVTVEAREYEQAGRVLSVEIYEMKDAAAAFGIYTFKRSSKGKKVDIGNEGTLESYYLNFWKGNFLVTLTHLEPDEGTAQSLLAMARRVEQEIVSQGEPPRLVQVMDVDGLKPESVKYLSGQLALFNCFSKLSNLSIEVDNAVCADFEAGQQAVVLAFRKDGDAHRVFNDLKNNVDDEAWASISIDSIDSFTLEMKDGRLLSFFAAGEHLVVVCGEDHEGASASLAAGLKAQLMALEPTE